MCEISSDLEKEIEFWKSMIAECVVDPESPEANRMHEALAFAEYKLVGELGKGIDLVS